MRVMSVLFLFSKKLKEDFLCLKKEKSEFHRGVRYQAFLTRKANRSTDRQLSTPLQPWHDRSNGLGGGFAGYGIYPQYKDAYAFHVFFDSTDAKIRCEQFLDRHFDVINLSKIPTKKIPSITNEPMIMRYFLNPLPNKLRESQLEEDEYVAQSVIKINITIEGAYVFSSGKNMGVFKAVGFPEDVGEFYRLDEYEGYCWTAHGRYPTNTPAGGEVLTRLHFWTIPLYITERYPLMTQTEGLSRCSDTNVLFLPIRKL